MALLAKLRPSGPWRVGADSGDRLRVGRVLHSDALYSALTRAFIELGELDAWLEATAMHPGGAEVRSSSCFPFVSTENGDALLLPPPESHWPPPDSLRIRWQSARYIPPMAIWQLLGDKPLIEEHWVVDGVSECLLPVIRNVPSQSPFRVTIRSHAAVDRLGQGVEPHQTACLEFSKGSGIWMAFSFVGQDAETRWAPALKGALKLIADSGLGGERSNGWGRFEQPEFVEGELGQLLFGNRYRAPEEVAGHWLLSLFSPAADDAVDWRQGNYRVVTRTGRVESAAGWGAAKRANQMIAEGGVLVAPVAPKGVARDVAPLGFAHPVYRAGFALTLPIGKPRPQQPKPNVVVDKTALESLAVGTPSEPRPSGSRSDTESSHVVEDQEARIPATAAVEPSGGSLPYGRGSEGERPSAEPSAAEDSTSVEPSAAESIPPVEAHSEPRPSESGPSEAHSEPQPSGSRPAEAAPESPTAEASPEPKPGTEPAE